LNTKGGFIYSQVITFEYENLYVQEMPPHVVSKDTAPTGRMPEVQDTLLEQGTQDQNGGIEMNFDAETIGLLKQKIRQRTDKALKYGEITRKSCELCGKKAEAHHNDYLTYDNLSWLCREHHRAWHANHKEELPVTQDISLLLPQPKTYNFGVLERKTEMAIRCGSMCYVPVPDSWEGKRVKLVLMMQKRVTRLDGEKT
jgi:hypothetical protein